MNAAKSLLIRADASARIGTGHLMRCLALAQEWQAQGGTVTFITRCESESLRQRLANEDFRIVDLQQAYPEPADWEITSQTLALQPNAWVVLDGYHFDPVYQRRIKEANHQLLVIDDMAHLDHYHADIVLNQNIYTHESRYPNREPYTQLLLGTSYVLLRREFWPRRDWQRRVAPVGHRVLVTLGGSDPENVTLKALQALQQLELPELTAKVVVGPANKHLPTLRQEVERSNHPIELLNAGTDMPELMAWADLAISAGGSTCWELAFMGTPMVIIILAENQKNITAGLAEAGAACNMGWYAALSSAALAETVTELLRNPTVRRQMSTRGRSFVDGRGVERVIGWVNRLVKSKT